MTRNRDEEERRAGDAERARRRARVFGDVLPESTRDDRPPGDAGTGGPDGGTTDAEDERLRAEVPPHHGPTG